MPPKYGRRGMEASCIPLKGLSVLCRFCDMVRTFEISVPEICLIFNHMIDFMHDIHG